MCSSRTRILLIALQLVYLVSAQEMVKRVPQGFVGMRGKKYLTNLDGSAEFEQYFKRKPQFFVGVKGKKSLSNPLDSEYFNYKRAPMGFVGMRGKKEDDNDVFSNSGSLIGTIDYTKEENHSDLQLMRSFLNEYLDSLDNEDDGLKFSSEGALEEDIGDQTNAIVKKATGIHKFFGVRGKKSIQSKRPFDLTFRGKFIGVRGKKDLKDMDKMQELRVLLGHSEPWPKRKSQMGFFGMRGKKWDQDIFSSETPSTVN